MTTIELLQQPLLNGMSIGTTIVSVVMLACCVVPVAHKMYKDLK